MVGVTLARPTARTTRRTTLASTYDWRQRGGLRRRRAAGTAIKGRGRLGSSESCSPKVLLSDSPFGAAPRNPAVQDSEPDGGDGDGSISVAESKSDARRCPPFSRSLGAFFDGYDGA